MTILDQDAAPLEGIDQLVETFRARWPELAEPGFDPARGIYRIACPAESLRGVCEALMGEFGCAFATLVVEEQAGWQLTYVFYRDARPAWIHVELRISAEHPCAPSISGLIHGPAADWHEREAKDLFGLEFEGHPRLGEFLLHEDWPKGVHPMRCGFSAKRLPAPPAGEPAWQPPMVLSAPGAFAMPIGPVFSDFAESAHFLLETVGEDVVRTIPRFFYNYRGVEKLAEGQPIDRVLLLAERFSGISAFAHGLAFCQAVEEICGVEPSPRAQILRCLFAELERLRHHAAVITGICNSTALAVSAAQAALIEEDLLRLSAAVGRHRYLFGLLEPGGMTCDLSLAAAATLAAAVPQIVRRLNDLHRMLRYSSSFLDRLEEVGIVATEAAVAYGLFGPIARASGVPDDMRKIFPYAAYRDLDLVVPVEQQGDGYARLRVFFREAEQAAGLICQALAELPAGPVRAKGFAPRAGVALAAVEAPHGAAFHWLRLDVDGAVARYRITPPAFANWHGFHLAAENFAFQDFPIILASFGLSNAECDR
jgi:formate hydrogenlyase subunit 5